MTTPNSLLSPDTVEQRAIRELEHAIRQARAERRLHAVSLSLRVVLAITVIALALRYTSGFGIDILMFLFCGTAVAETAIHARRNLAQRVSDLSSPRAVGALAVAYGSDDPVVRRYAKRGLKRLLAQVQPENQGDFSPEGMAALVRLLTCHDADLVFGALWAVAEVGPVTVIPTVERLARGHVEAAWNKRSHLDGPPPLKAIQSSARTCLEQLRKRAAEEEERGRLLRPVEQPAPELLRPVISMPSVDTSALLRPAEPQ